ncbi:MAG: hypothetical protein Q4B05_01020 [Candidatus Saccharibacteria bacterium]|nr:hypothetical protein [Candidatus Saccharibacteria bacterium]
MSNSERGSVWRKWDLHIHSPATHMRNGYGSTTHDQFIKKLQEKELSAIGLTNYFNFTDDDFTLKSALEKAGIAVFLNLEIRLSYQNKEDDCCDLHIIFDPEVSRTDMEDFLTQLKVNVNGNEKLAKNLSSGHDFIKATVELDDLRKVLNEESLGLKNKYMIGFLSRGKGSGRTSSNYEKIAKHSHFLIHSSDKIANIEEDRAYWLGENKPLLQSSDAHDINQIGEKYSWIKADLAFDGLRQVLYEPDERIAIQERNPNDSKTERLMIDCVAYVNHDGSNEKIKLNSNLNSIIGSRGSGKSTLLKNIAKTIDPEEFSERDKKSPYDLANFEVTWKDGQVNGGRAESPKSIFYIPQNYLSALAYDDGERSDERDAFLTQLLKKNECFANAIQSFDSFVSKNKVHIEELIQKLLDNRDTIRENTSLLKKQGSKAEIEQEKEQKQQQLKKYKVGEISESDIKKYSASQTAISAIKKSINVLSQDKDILGSLHKSGANIFISDQEFSLLSQDRQELIQQELKKRSKASLRQLIHKELSAIDNQIKKLSKNLLDNEKISKELGEQIKKSKALDDLTKEISSLDKSLSAVKLLTEQLDKAKEEEVTTIDLLVKAYDEFENQQSIAYKTIKFDEKFSFLSVRIVARYNTLDLKRFVERYINTRDTSQAIKKESDIMNLFSDRPEKLGSNTVRKIITGLLNNQIIPKVDAKKDISIVLSQLLKNRFEIDYLNSVRTKDGITHFKDMTGGQKAIALLELIFRLDDEKYPILIDQPEDDLDVSGVANDLVDFILTEKKDRQIIIVSHNASLVICADTENVIVSNMKIESGNRLSFKYATGSIENLDRRKDIINVLEGGEPALRKRMEKLSI